MRLVKIDGGSLINVDHVVQVSLEQDPRGGSSVRLLLSTGTEVYKHFPSTFDVEPGQALRKATKFVEGLAGGRHRSVKPGLPEEEVQENDTAEA